ncbi:sensor domain-containing diguanylate cyclase [Maridesulfovibrio hydrothermalis]|uniref:Diguanylate cyclase with PAS/PAC sensor n=1 Tax=Maridesulfovibrio hydrothermalis AM13 = DSM 14728 TaxID=1121451 RepID=L0RDN7_9BACT|nr:diguanylate cyclase [Maridesulfovibrio hydrothermalis]CCO23681.1 Diguanylate cyclase with PAS/PAC sensor [Maridesulfovibrio hydrothermalis AM13 = DSM 14728]
MVSKCSSTVLKYFLKRYLPVAVLILVISAGVLYTQRAQYVELVKDHEINLIKGDYIALSSWLASGIEDISLISGLVENRMIADGSFAEKYDDIAKIFSIFGQERRNCVQVRYISTKGKELVRINMDQGEALRVGSEFLQDKSDRDYFKDISNLGDGVYVSAFNLNEEFGKVVVPHAPVLRFAKKVFGDGGGELGSVIINLSGNDLLSVFSKASDESFGQVYFVNENGGWIVGPQESHNWRFLLGQKDGFMKDEFPEQWAIIAEESSGQFVGSNGLYTYTSLKEGSFAVPFSFKVKFKEDWKIISNVAKADLAVPWSNITLLLILFLYILSGFLFWRKTISVVEQEKVSAALKKSEKRFMDVADAAGEFIWETGPDGCFIFVTGRAQDILGYSSEELIGRSPFDFVDEESSWEVRKEFLDAAQNGKSFTGLVFKFVNRDGRKLWLEFNGVPVFDEQGVVTGFRGASSDISGQRKALQDLQDRENMLQSISDSVQDALVLMDEGGLVHFWNPAAEKIFGYTAGEMLGESLQCCILPEDNVDIEGGGEEGAGVNELLANYGSFTVNVRRKGGTVFPAEVLLSPLRKDEKWWVVGTIRDVTERKEAEDKLRKLATTDPLTGLSNRRFFMESSEDALQRSLRYERELSLLVMDIDFFKNVNDMFGHDAGDDVLKSLSAVGLKILRSIDVFGRIGGEEFAILLPDTRLEGAKLVAERFRKEIEQARMFTRSGELTITVSIGVATLNEKTRTLEHLLKAADIGLYAAKNAGRNRVEVQLSPEGSVD